MISTWASAPATDITTKPVGNQGSSEVSVPMVCTFSYSSVDTTAPTSTKTQSAKAVSNSSSSAHVDNTGETPPVSSVPEGQNNTLHHGLTPCIESPSITSNAVIAGLNKYLPQSPMADHPPPPPTTSPVLEPTNTYATRLRISTDRTLKRLAPTTFSPDGVPRVLVPDAVFNRGAKAHKDFILGVFTGKAPSYSHIQSVLTSVWGRGRKMEIHLRI